VEGLRQAHGFPELRQGGDEIAEQNQMGKSKDAEEGKTWQYGM